uniref:LRRCT domain-containing protein n=1 Tax=Branchiostoma floridae TaxID=7739 RepID=C3YTX3_BRAFL|eukprot:XP_002600238.1 hypothetical protein BRAFLDRAFT_66743 [Branchiostoma floridae]
MGRKLRHLLMFLIIILKEPNLPEAGCSCVQSLRCYCRNQRLTNIHQNLPASISNLDVGNNLITSVSPSELLRYLDTLKTLFLDYNQITMIRPGTFANLPWLQQLSMSNNQITMIDAGTFANLPRLQRLDLSKNQITKIHADAFANLPSLANLCLSKNSIAMIHSGVLANLPQLQKLILSTNHITTIQAGVYANLIHLKKLVLHSNQITMIHSGAFSNLPQLQRLDLSNNNISAIAPLAYGLLPSNLIIKLDGNPWQCDCKMLPFRLDMTEFPSVKDQVICAQPANLRGQKLAGVNPEELVCLEPTMPTLPADAQVTCSNHCNGTAGPASKTSRPRETIASPLQTTSDKPESKSCRADTHVTSNSYNNGTTASSTRSPKGKRVKTVPTLASPLQTTSDKLEGSSSSRSAPSFPFPVLIASICGSAAGVVLVGSIILTIWCKRRTSHPPNTAVSVIASGHDQTGQGQAQAQHMSVEKLSCRVALQPNPYAGSEGPPKDQASTAMTSGHDQTGQGQSQAIIKLNKNTTATIVSSHDHQYEDVDNHHNQRGQGQLQALKFAHLSRNKLLAALKPNPMYRGKWTPPTTPAPTSGHHRTGQGTSQASTQSYRNTTADSGYDHQYEDIDLDKQHTQTGQGQSQSITKPNATATVMSSGYDHQYEDIDLDKQHNQTGQGQSQSITKPNATATVMSSSYDHQYEDIDLDKQHNQTGQGQSQSITKPNATATVMSSGYDHQYEDIDLDKQHNQTGQGQSQSITKPNATATVMSSGYDHQYEDIDQTNNPIQGRASLSPLLNPTQTTVLSSGYDHQYEDIDKQHPHTGQDSL